MSTRELCLFIFGIIVGAFIGESIGEELMRTHITKKMFVGKETQTLTYEEFEKLVKDRK